MKNFNYPLIIFSFIFSLIISLIFSVFAYLYIQEIQKTKKIQEEHNISCYANKITYKVKSIKELKEKTFGTVESFTYKIAIYDRKLNILYSTFEKKPSYDISRKTYVENEKIFYVDNKSFSDIGEVRVVLRKNLNYKEIENKITYIIFGIIIFFVLSFSTLYFTLKKLYLNINKNFNIFFRNAIHEIRTPLGVLQINLEFLENVIENSMALKRARGGLNNLTSVYETIEYYIKYKKVKFPKEDINLSEFLETRLSFLNICAEIKEIKLETDIENNIFIKMSRIELQRLIDNNLSNAIKYSKEHTKIEVKLHIKEDSIFLLFANEGAKIPDIEGIFQRYYRGDDIKGGFGLGLNIVHHICNLYDIKIVVKSDGKINSFLYKIPNKLNKKIKDA